MLLARQLLYACGNKARGSRCIDQFTMAVDAGEHIGVAHGGGFYQINAAPQQLLQRGFGAKKFIQPGMRVSCEFHQEIGIAGVEIEIDGACGEAKRIQTADTVTLANGGNSRPVSDNQRVHKHLSGLVF